MNQNNNSTTCDLPVSEPATPNSQPDQETVDSDVFLDKIRAINESIRLSQKQNKTELFIEEVLE